MMHIRMKVAILLVILGVVLGTDSCNIEIVDGWPKRPQRFESQHQVLCYLAALKNAPPPRYGKRYELDTKLIQEKQAISKNNMSANRMQKKLQNLRRIENANTVRLGKRILLSTPQEQLNDNNEITQPALKPQPGNQDMLKKLYNDRMNNMFKKLMQAYIVRYGKRLTPLMLLDHDSIEDITASLDSKNNIKNMDYFEYSPDNE